MQYRKATYVWNLRLGTSNKNALFTETLNIYSSMLKSAGSVYGTTNFTFPLVLKACANLPSLKDGIKIHSQLFLTGHHSDVFVQTALLDMYSKCNDLASSRKVFDEMSLRSVVSWNSMISAYSRASCIGESFLLLKQMMGLGLEPSSGTFVGIVSSCSDPVFTLRQGFSIHTCIIKCGLHSELALLNSVMSMYIHFGCIEDACSIFYSMDERSIISWTTILGGYVNDGNVTQLFNIFNEMRRQNISADVVVFVKLVSGCSSARNLSLASLVHCLALKSGCDQKDPLNNLLVSMYSNCGNLVSARRIFDAVHEKNVCLWTSMISGYARLGDPDEAVKLFNKVLTTDITPNEITVATILSACANLGSLSLGGKVEDYILRNGLESDLRVQTSLIHMLCKCGSVAKAKQVFDRVLKKDLAVWTSMINGYALHGMGEEALSLFHKMKNDEGIKPDSVLYTSVLFACSHSGLVEDGLKYFKSMKRDYGIEPGVEHYSCLVDLLGRAGCFDLALKTVEKMPIEDQARGWAPLLGACRTHHKIELGELAAKRLLDLNPESTGNYVMVSNFYCSVGKSKEAALARRLINDRGLAKEPGWSQIEINGSFHVFIAGDRSHHQSVDIYTKLEEVGVKLVEAGYIAETETVVQELEEEEKVEALKVHSERLAVAFGLVSTEEGSTLTIIKNLRTCADCHSALKIISKVTGRHLIVRDGMRFHHFEDGVCSCKDFW